MGGDQCALVSNGRVDAFALCELLQFLPHAGDLHFQPGQLAALRLYDSLIALIAGMQCAQLVLALRERGARIQRCNQHAARIGYPQYPGLRALLEHGQLVVVPHPMCLPIGSILAHWRTRYGHGQSSEVSSFEAGLAGETLARLDR